MIERGEALIKKYSWKKGRGIALRLLFTRYFTAGVAFTAATVEKYFGENIPLLLLLGVSRERKLQYSLRTIS